MTKEQIFEVLNDWNFWQKKQKIGIRREEYLGKIERFVKTGQIVTLAGVRRSGKSTLMLQYINELIEKGLEPKNTLYINFEEPRFLDKLSLKFLQEIYEAYQEFLEPRKPFILLDEAQNVPSWEKFVRALHERGEATILVSGSSSKLLSEEFGDVLTGRHLLITVYPLSFKEFLQFKDLRIKNKLELISQRFKIKRLLREYLEFGGFPKVVLEQEKKEILRRYFEDIISHDVTQRYKIRKVDKLKALGKYYLTNSSSLVSFNKIKKFLGLPLYTVERFSYYLSYGFLIFFVKKFAYSLKEQEVNLRKVYAIDPGLRNIVSFRFSQDLGRLYENVVFLELLRRGEEVYYWKNKRESDFLLKEKGEAIQVCTRVDNPETKKRELEGLAEVMKKFKLGKGLLITQDLEKEERVKNKEVKFIPLWKWLLS